MPLELIDAPEERQYNWKLHNEMWSKIEAISIPLNQYLVTQITSTFSLTFFHISILDILVDLFSLLIIVS